MTPKNCWELKKCRREQGGIKIKEMGVCPAYPHHGRYCWMVAGTFCGGKVSKNFRKVLSNDGYAKHTPTLRIIVFRKTICIEPIKLVNRRPKQNNYYQVISLPEPPEQGSNPDCKL